MAPVGVGAYLPSIYGLLCFLRIFVRAKCIAVILFVFTWMGLGVAPYCCAAAAAGGSAVAAAHALFAAQGMCYIFTQSQMVAVLL
jgi:hypothetical protein